MFDTMCSCLSFDVNNLFFFYEVIQSSFMIYVMDYVTDPIPSDRNLPATPQ